MPLPQDVVGPLTSLIIGLINLQSPPSGGQAGRFYSMVFRDLPDRSVYPDYYVVIKEPRSLNGVLVSVGQAGAFIGSRGAAQYSLAPSAACDCTAQVFGWSSTRA